MTTVQLLLDTAETIGPARAGSRRFWTGREELILRNVYPAEGLTGCLTKLPGRSVGAIYQRANQLNLRAPRETRPRQRHTTTEHIDALIRRTYEGKPDKGAVKRLAQTIGRPRTWIRDRAIKIGCAVPRFKEPRWTDAEREIVRENAHRHPATIARALKRAGYMRTDVAIQVQIKRMGACTADPNHYTARGLGLLLGIDAKTVTGCIAKGWLTAKRRGTDRVAAQGGDEWWIHRRDVRRFVVENVGAVDFRKLDKFWLVDLLAGGDE